MHKFENDVKTYGTQASFVYNTDPILFENDVKTYGTQAVEKIVLEQCGLRMM